MTMSTEPCDMERILVGFVACFPYQLFECDRSGRFFVLRLRFWNARLASKRRLSSNHICTHFLPLVACIFTVQLPKSRQPQRTHEVQCASTARDETLMCSRTCNWNWTLEFRHCDPTLSTLRVAYFLFSLEAFLAIIPFHCDCPYSSKRSVCPCIRPSGFLKADAAQ